jgi:hypothetical protein
MFITELAHPAKHSARPIFSEYKIKLIEPNLLFQGVLIGVAVLLGSRG